MGGPETQPANETTGLPRWSGRRRCRVAASLGYSARAAVSCRPWSG